MTTNCGTSVNWSQYLAVRRQLFLACLGLLCAESIQVGADRCLGIDRQDAAVRQANEHIGPAILPTDLLLKVDVLDHPCQLDHAMQLQLTPLPLCGRRSQGLAQGMRRLLERGLSLRKLAQLLLQSLVGALALFFELADPLVQFFQAGTQRFELGLGAVEEHLCVVLESLRRQGMERVPRLGPHLALAYPASGNPGEERADEEPGASRDDCNKYVADHVSVHRFLRSPGLPNWPAA
jgi:hypothetical protein